MKCEFVRAGHSSHSAGGDGHGHTHETLTSPGTFTVRVPKRNDWDQRAFTVGVAGPVGSGKTALVLALCQHLRDRMKVCVVTNDIFTREDWEFLVKHEALPAHQIAAVETGGCPHAAIREDISANLSEARRLTKEHTPDIIFVEAGGDNLAATFSRELADYVIYVVDVAGGDKIPRKGGPGVTQSDLLVINKSDLAEMVGASVETMLRDASLMRGSGPCLVTEAKHGKNVPLAAEHVLKSWNACRS